MRTWIRNLGLAPVFLALVGATAPGTATMASNELTRCNRACADDSPYCRTLPMPSELKGGLNFLRDKLGGNSTPIARGELMQRFGVASDPCGRSDSLFSNGQWTNKGDACNLTGKAEFVAGFSPVTFELAIPGNLQVRPETVAGKHVYRSVGEAVTLRIDDPDLYNDWGGTVGEITDTGSALQFQMPRGCIALQASS